MLAVDINQSHVGMTYKTGQASKMKRRTIQEVDQKSSYVALLLKEPHGGTSWTVLGNDTEVVIEP